MPRWFEGVRLNWAENALYTRDTSSSSTEALCKLNKEDDKIAFTEVREGNTEIRHVTWGELRHDVAALAAALKERGLQKGDRVVIVGGHSYRTYVVFMATVWLGGIFSSSSTDMGVGGLLQRAVQVNPKVRSNSYVFWVSIRRSVGCDRDETDVGCSLSSLMMAPYTTARQSI